MANQILYTVGTQISFADHAGDFAPAAANSLEQGIPLDVQLSLASVADAAARQSAKVDFGATRARRYSVVVAIEMAATPVSGDILEFYWCASPDSVAANGNPGYASGVDAAYTGTPATLAEGVAQLIFIGAFVCSADATTTVQIANIGVLAPPERYGSLIVKNEAGSAFFTDDVETHIVFTPIIDEVQ